MAAADLAEYRRRMAGALDVLRKELTGLRTGRASADLLNPVMVEAYGQHTPISRIGTVNVPEPRLITVQVWDRGLVKAVDKAIRDSGLGLNPQSEGQVIRVPLPDLTQERRKELTKVAHKYAEAGRVSVRNVRRDAMEHLKKLEKDGDLSQDDFRRAGTEVQSLTDEHIKKIDDLLLAKEKDILQV
ncbi:MAG: ribosome recycling factor [Alphaproteobacteria bacterium]|nr:ribosome recycling factor [Alphaproteobacteria bacterium]